VFPFSLQDPIDLRTIGERLDDGFYSSLEMFAADFRRMFNNARIYNAPETLYYKVCQHWLHLHTCVSFACNA
jgi:Bromodomain